MSNMVDCVRKKKLLQGLSKPPMPGELGLKIYKSLSQEAWREWQEIQTMLINEYRLNLMNKGDRETIYEELDRFLKGEEVLKPDEFKAE